MDNVQNCESGLIFIIYLMVCDQNLNFRLALNQTCFAVCRQFTFETVSTYLNKHL
jgi:hypothetical protein